MVVENRGLPDPGEDKEEDVRATNEVVVNEVDSDSGDENDYEGYQRLPVSDFLESSNSEGENGEGISVDPPPNEETSPCSNVTSEFPPIDPIEQDLVREVWSKPPPKSVDIEMDSTKVDEVKQAMLGITLPESAIPQWASNIPEDEWKKTLLEKLRLQQNQKNVPITEQPPKWGMVATLRRGIRNLSGYVPTP